MQTNTETTACGSGSVRAVAQQSAEAQNFTPEITPALERVARAICAACEDNPDHTGDARGNAYRWEDYIGVAQAAIDAMGDGWLPIESAPIGKDVLVYRPSYVQLFDVMRRNAVGNWRWPDGETPLRDPTHWQPLPEPPKQHGNDTQEGNEVARGGL